MGVKLEPVSVSDIERAGGFCVEKVGFNAKHDVQPGV
jgi:hypothetical protein